MCLIYNGWLLLSSTLRFHFSEKYDALTKEANEMRIQNKDNIAKWQASQSELKDYGDLKTRFVANNPIILLHILISFIATQISATNQRK